MNVATASDKIQDMQGQSRAMIRRQMEEWFQWMDRILDVHRSTFVFREATEAQREDHKTALKNAIRCCLFINGLIADPDSNSPDLAARLQVRIRQLQDAYDTFHDAGLSDEQAGKILKQVFPE